MDLNEYNARLEAYARVIDHDAWRITDEQLKPIAVFSLRRTQSLKAAQSCICLADVERDTYALALRYIEERNRQRPLWRRVVSVFQA